MLVIDKDGTISLYQGDSGEIFINGLDKTKDYMVYFAVQDFNRKPVGEELCVSVSNSENITFVLTSDFTDLLTVPLKNLMKYIITELRYASKILL